MILQAGETESSTHGDSDDVNSLQRELERERRELAELQRSQQKAPRKPDESYTGALTLASRAAGPPSPSYDGVTVDNLERALSAIKEENRLLQRQHTALRGQRYLAAGEAATGHVGSARFNAQEAASMAKGYELELLRMAKQQELMQDEIDHYKRLLRQKDEQLVLAGVKTKEATALALDLDETHWQVEAKNRDIAQASATIERLEQRVVQLANELEATIRQKNLELEAMATDFVEKGHRSRQQLKEKDQQLSQLQEELDQYRKLGRESAMQAIPRTAEDKETLVLKLRSLVEKKTSETVNLQSIVKEQRRQLNLLQDKLASETGAYDLDDETRERERQSVILLQRKLLQEKAEEIKNLSHLAAAHKEQIAILQTQLASWRNDSEALSLHHTALDQKRGEADTLSYLAIEQHQKLLLLQEKRAEEQQQLRQLEHRLASSTERSFARDRHTSRLTEAGLPLSVSSDRTSAAEGRLSSLRQELQDAIRERERLSKGAAGTTV